MLKLVIQNSHPTSGKLHKIPQVTYNLELICGSVAVIGDLTRPISMKINKNKKTPQKKKRNELFTFFLFYYQN